ncbi:MAG TPA: bifunctional [glutamine synthetase] adenylyltransferase/[glutamine synthetase]-adenylyl-L-tyrosine phosphorylase, partial [Actinomycetes bacterium]|nr:bifunctional [glutamine synthetase] adenylyltransferase/[glutamine synthetase]-adenylyl-L-tyrosine phosphorylase [Actinomycetes bacterium]
MTAQRGQSILAQLSRRGFVDAARAGALLEWVPLSKPLDDVVLDALGATADPDLALQGLVRVLEACDEREQLAAHLISDAELRLRLTAVLGVSSGLGDHLVRHPTDYRILASDGSAPTRPTAAALRASMLVAVGADPAADMPVAASQDALVALRVDYRRHLLHLAARDLTEGAAVDDVAAELADLAAAALDAGLAIARAELSHEAEPVRLAIVGLGKCGGRELNYVSDVDVVYVAEPLEGGDEEAAINTANRLAAGVARACTAMTPEGYLWEVDAGLRPEGAAGPLVRTLGSHVAYYKRWAKSWEFQALLKARPVAGDVHLGEAYVDALGPMVWEAAAREGFVQEVQAMRRRVEQQIPAADAGRQLKLGPGGLRDVEFAVQLLQLVHGRSDPTLRSGNTLRALDALAVGGYVGRDDAAQLDDAYRFMRTLEHRIQLFRLRRTHLLPEEPEVLRRLGRSVGFRKDPVAELEEEWRRQVREVRRLHEKLFYRPLLNAVARLEPGEVRLTPDAARARMEALGYRDPAGALRHIEALTSGVSRRAAIQRTLLPVMLGWFADAADPDAGLFGFRRVSEALGGTHWYLALLRDAGATAERLARVLASSRYATDLLLRAPEAVAMLSDDAELQPRSRAELTAEMLSTGKRSVAPDAAIAAIRGVRRRELFRLSAAMTLDQIRTEELGAALSDVAASVVVAALEVANRSVNASTDVLPTRFAVIAMGRFGGRELGLGSDLDVMFVHQPVDGADEQAATTSALAIANELTRLLAIPAPDPAVMLDSDLRPEGRSGPLVRTLASYAAYYERWSLVWESQALIRAELVAGDATLGAEFLSLVDQYRWPEAGLSEDDIREIRRVKARVESE